MNLKAQSLNRGFHIAMEQSTKYSMKSKTQSLLDGMTYWQRCFGCQMNEADAEHVAGMLEAAGCRAVATLEEADIVVYLTCCVREAADIRLLGQVASMKNVPPAHDGRQRIVAVGGCIGQRDKAALFTQLDNVDVVFGTHNLSRLVRLLERRLETGEPVVETIEKNDGRAYNLALHRDKPWHAWVPIMTGCNNFCTYCIVPYVRGREQSRPIDDVKGELACLAADGVVEATLLGQNVNSYGRDLYGKPRFSEVLNAAGQSGIKRVRFVTSHPKDLSEETIAAMAAHDNIMPHLHLPLQSGSDRILKAMGRVYDSEHYRSLVASLRAAIPDIALSTDIIVGFPGETQIDFEATCELVAEIGYSQVFTFIYSRRAGTPAAELPNDTPDEIIHKRFEHLVAIVQKCAYEQNARELGKRLPVLVEGLSRRNANMLSGKSPKNQTVHAPLPSNVDIKDLVGSIVDIEIDATKTWYLKGHLVG